MEALQNTLNTPGGAGAPITAGVLSAIGASACCAGPLVLVALGLGGAWVSGLRALEPLFPVFVFVALGAFGFAFWRLYVAPRRCTPDIVCASPRVLRRQRVTFWITLVAAKALILFPFYAPRLLA